MNKIVYVTGMTGTLVACGAFFEPRNLNSGMTTVIVSLPIAAFWPITIPTIAAVCTYDYFSGRSTHIFGDICSTTQVLETTATNKTVNE